MAYLDYERRKSCIESALRLADQNGSIKTAAELVSDAEVIEDYILKRASND